MLLCAAILAEAAHSRPPKRVGTCDQTAVKAIGTRFSDRLVKPQSGAIDEGTSVILTNGVVGIAYDFVPAVAASKVGDPVLT